MTGYMYNPSGKISEMLSEYLEFDPEQLSVGIWSGNLSLHDVSLREEALYPLLNQYLKRKGDEQQQQNKPTTSELAKNYMINNSSNSKDGNNNNNSSRSQSQFAYAKPPARLKLVSGTIGSLEMKIPWQRLVWGPGDVEVNLRNVVLVLALETAEETQERWKRARADDDDMDSDDWLFFSNCLLPGHSKKNKSKPTVPDKGGIDHRADTTAELLRELKQMRLGEAERRQLEGRLTATWMDSIRKKDKEKIAKILAEEEHTEKESLGRINRWLSSATKDFFFRFCAGLVMNLENVKIVLVQDGIEVGMIMPSIRLTNTKFSPARRASTSAASSTVKTPTLHHSDISGEWNRNNNNGDVSPQNNSVVYQGEKDDGEHVEKIVKILGLGIYVRRTPEQRISPKTNIGTGTDDHSVRGFAADVSTKEFVLRPVDCTFDYSFFYPAPPDKRKRKLVAASANKDPEVHTATTVGTADASASCSSSSKRRRGKRDKNSLVVVGGGGLDRPLPVSPVQTTRIGFTPTTGGGDANSTDGLLPKAPLLRQGRANTIGTTSFNLSSRRQSIAVRQTTTPTQLQLQHQVPQQLVSSLRTSSSSNLSSAPLVRRVNIANEFANTVAASKNSIRIESKLTLGAVEVICSTSHYGLVSTFMACCARTRIGRPSTTIRSVLEERYGSGGAPLRRSLTVMSHNQKRRVSNMSVSTARHSATALSSTTGPSRHAARSNSIRPAPAQLDVELRLRLQGGKSPRSAVIWLWWRYVLRAVVWELRERKRLRTEFRKRFLYFSWESQQYRRQEYVKLYSAFHLSNSGRMLMEGSRSPNEELLAIEDELSIEQILLYRSIARAVLVRGGRTMPDSILDLRDNSNDNAPPQDRDGSVVSQPGIGRRDSMAVRSITTTREIPSLLTLLSKQGETARSRVCIEQFDRLPLYHPYFSPTGSGNRHSSTVHDDTTYAHTVDTRSVRQHRRRALLLVNEGEDDSESKTILISFVFEVEKLGFVLMEDSDYGYGQATAQSQCDSSSSSSSSIHSPCDVSVLTDDQRFFRDDGSVPMMVESESIEDAPILSSTDFLIFRAPENVLLRLSITLLSLSMLAKSGGSRNVNMKVGRVAAYGENSQCLLTAGLSSRSAPIPISEVGFGGEIPSVGGAVEEWNLSAPKDAFSVSLIINKSGNLLECDVSTIRILADFAMLLKLRDFSESVTTKFPMPFLLTTPDEVIRMFLLKQNVTILRTLNCSLRIHGFEIAVPVEVDFKDGASSNDNSDTEDADKPTLAFRLRMIEIYSGTAVAALGDAADDVHALVTSDAASLLSSGQSRLSSKTRILSMLDVTEMTALRPSILSHHWVFTASGIDCVMNFCPPMFYPWSKSFLENPVDVEVLLTANANSIGDNNRARREFVVRLSPVDFVLSQGRVDRIAKTLSKIPLTKPETTGAAPLPPRLEVLSQFMVHTVDLKVERVRLSLADDDKDLDHDVPSLSKQAVVREILSRFLEIVSSFDLSYPNEESLASAMQISIDRLSGLGVCLEDSWEITNTALLNYLEDCGVHDADQDAALTSSVDRTFTSFWEVIKPLDLVSQEDAQPPLYDFVLDVPEGVKASAVGLFYDNCVTVCIPTMFVTDSDGIHLLRVTPPEDMASGDESQKSVNVPSNASEIVQDEEGSVAAREREPAGATFRAFQLDNAYPFGRGGHPLSGLGVDVHGGSYFQRFRRREKFHDLELADFEIMFCRPVVDKLVTSVTNAFSPLLDLAASTGKNRSGSTSETLVNESEALAQSHLLISMSSSSLLFVTDDFSPFVRLVLKGQLMRKCFAMSLPLLDTDQADHSSCIPLGETSFNARSLLLMNLTREGEHYPEILSALPGPLVSLLSIRLSESYSHFHFRGVRLFLLQQHISEILQYFVSGKYGFGLFWASIATPGEKKTQGKRHCTCIEFQDSSILLPRSTSSSDMVAVEVETAAIRTSRPQSSFVMPTASSGLSIPCDDVHQDLDWDLLVSRITIELRGIRLLTSLPPNVDTVDGTESPSFRFFFSVDGRAEHGNSVYCRRGSPLNAAGTDGENIGTDLTRESRYWVEVTKEPSSFDILYDQVPHIRILISDPLDSSSGGLSFDMKLSQFALLLSIWYSNLQELPVTFPFSASQLEAKSRYLASFHQFPAYGSPAYRTLLLKPTNFTSELGVSLKHLSWRCVFDDSYLGTNEQFVKDSSAIHLDMQDIVVLVTSDSIGVTRIGSGASAFLFTDESKAFDLVVQCGVKGERQESWGDLTFGLTEDYSKLSEALSQAFQFSLFMTPGWSLYNVGVDEARVVMLDFSSIFRLLDFLTRYFNEPKLGNPSFEAAEHAKALKRELAKHIHSDGESLHSVQMNETENKGSSMDFRLWLHRPLVCIPCETFDSAGPGVRIECEGFWYRYSSMVTFASHEIVSSGLDLLFDGMCSRSGVSAFADTNLRKLVDGLLFGLRLDVNRQTSHTDVSFQIPFLDSSSCSIVSHRLSTQPLQSDPAVICVPFRQPERVLGPSVCEVTVIIELLPLVSSALLNLFRPPEELNNDESVVNDSLDGVEESSAFVGSIERAESVGVSESTLSYAVKIADIRVFSFDPVLGPHLPVAALSVAHLDITSSRFGIPPEGARLNETDDMSPEDLHVLVRGHFWADYFKLGLTRSWEPLLEAYKFDALYEKSLRRGSGLSITSDSSFHLNISGALLVILDEVIDSYRRSILSTFDDENHVSIAPMGRTDSVGLSHTTDEIQLVGDSVENSTLFHEIPRIIGNADRVPFAVRNLTGQEMRLCKQNGQSSRRSDGSLVVSYIDHEQSAQLIFLPSVSVVNNMSVIEVEFPGLPNGKRAHGNPEAIAPHAIDLQLPGFHWLQRIKVDTFGRSFFNIVPASPLVLAKVSSDWRLANTMKLLVEVGLQNGGRQVTVRSLFSIANRSGHRLCLISNPDPSFEPQSDDANFGADIRAAENEIDPGEVYQVPVLLTESALHQPGSHLGCIWVRPSTSELAPSFQSFIDEKDVSSSSVCVDYSTRPVQLAKVVSESALLFENQQKSEISQHETKTGVHVSCPVILGSDRLAPFCYVVEVSRSPLVTAPVSAQDQEKSRGRRIHGPVVYSLSIHPTFVVINLLPRKGRFELMHAVRRMVLWFADLEPGEQVSVHSVGLDAPLLLLLNLGFCKTPVGEGALVHHGVDLPRGTRETIGLKSIGKAGKAVTKQLGKTLTKIGETPDKRGHKRLFLVQNPQFLSKGQQVQEPVVANQAKTDLGLDTDVTGIDTAAGKTFRIDNAVFSPQDVAAETTVVDGIGQRLTLNIENIRGGGGQRRISVFSPFWIANTTEHSLRYRQDKSTTFVSGTVSSPEKDGSVPLRGGRAEANYEAPHRRHLVSLTGNSPMTQGTIFSGMPGALATSPGRCDLPPEEVAHLIDVDLPLEKLARMAFMFNFNEGMLSLGNQKLCMQIWDGTGLTRYVSDWSQGFSLDSVGFSQVVGMHCKDGRVLELTVVVSVAPGFLSGYTKIVRIVSRFFIVNALPYPVRLWQDSSIFRPSSDNTGEAATKERKWRIVRDKNKMNLRKVNQYEALWGRETILDDRSVEDIPRGSTAHASALYVASVGPSEVIPFTLPDSRGERQLRVDLGGSWNLTASVSADIPGEHTVRVTRAVDLKMIPHVSTRGSPEYDMKLRPEDLRKFSNELGIWFETEWGNERKVIVKAVKKDSFAFQETDLHVGDELLSIDGEPVHRLTFSEAMSKLRTRLAALENAKVQESGGGRQVRRASLRIVGLGPRGFNSLVGLETGVPPLKLRFRTMEERLRRVRMNAARANDLHQSGIGALAESDASSEALTLPSEKEPFYLKVDLRAVQHSYFFVIREEKSVPYQIHNRSIESTIYYRQRGCDGHQWQFLKPGQSDVYSWEEPLRTKRLVVRVAIKSSFPASSGVDDCAVSDDSTSDSSRIRRFVDKTAAGKTISNTILRNVKDEEDSVFSPSVNVRLEEIGFKEFLPCHVAGEEDRPSKHKYLELEVEVQGTTRVLVVKDASTEDGVVQLEQHLDALKSRLDEEELRLDALRELKSSAEVGDDDKTLSKATDFMEDFPEETMVTGCHQIIVEVLEANGLNTDTFAGSCNPYAEVYMKCARVSRFSRFRRRDLRRTYFIKKAVSPIWKSQSFVFSVPPEAATATRGHSVKVRLRNFRVLGYHKVLGAAQVELHSVRDQNSLVGWFPLEGTTGRHELENAMSHWGRGSIKLRLQWIYTPSALLEYFILLSEKRLLDLQESLEGLTLQLGNQRDAEAKRREQMDGFREVRIHDMLSLSKAQMKLPHRPLVTNRVEHVGSSGSEDPWSPNSTQVPSVSFAPKLQDVSLARFGGLTKSPSLRFSDPGKSSLGKQTKAQALELLINQTRLNRRASLGEHLDSKKCQKLAQNEYSGTFTASSFKSMSTVHVLFRDDDFVAEIDGDVVKVRLKDESHERPGEPFALCGKFRLPLSAPAAMVTMSVARADSFSKARSAFERAAHRKIESVLHPGGWLIVRPLTALNLPDAYTGMFVKLRYGPEVLLSETVDAKVIPTWAPKGVQNRRRRHRTRGSSESADGSPNDLHIRVAPQKTSGAIILSVVGERSHANLHSKAEVGVLHLPLGATIAACIDSEEAHRMPATYMRWFPLMNPTDVVPVEGDLGLSFRPPESEKQSDNSFHEYFAPCIQVALTWLPDSEGGAREDDPESDAHRRLSTADRANSAKSRSLAPRVTHYCFADIGRISASLIDSQRALELVSSSATDIEVRYWTTKAKTRMGFSVGWLQVDQLHDNALEPVILAPTPSDYVGPVIQILAVRDNLRSMADVISFDFIDISVEEFDLTLEENILFDLFDFINSVKLRRGLRVLRSAQPVTEGNEVARPVGQTQSLMVSEEANDQPDLLNLLLGGDGPSGSQKSGSQKKVYIEQLFLGIVKVNLSYLKGKRQTWELTTSGWVDKVGDGRFRVPLVNLSGEDKLFSFSFLFHEKSEHMTKWSLLTSDDDREAESSGTVGQSWPQLFAALFPNISDAPIRLQGKAVNHIFESPTEILQSVQKFYVNETLRQVYRIIGSLDFVGNPTMLFTSFFSGLRDLVVTPSRAFMMSPTNASGVGIGVAKGTISLFSHSTSGFFGFWAKVSAAAGQGLSWLTLDPDYCTWHRDRIVVEATNLNRVWKRRGVQSLKETIARPVLDIFLGVGGAVTSVVVMPIKGYKRGGGTGLLLGVAGAGISLIVKPIIGVLDAMAHFSASIHDLAKSVNVLQKRMQPALRLRLPSTFGIMYILAPFNQHAARAVNLLRQFPMERSQFLSLSYPETLVHVEVLPNVTTDTYIIVSSHRVILIRLRRLTSGALAPSLGWEVALTESSKVSSLVAEHGHNGIALTLTRSKPAEDDPVQIKPTTLTDADDVGLIDDFEVENLTDQLRSLYDLADEQFHGTTRGDEGELLEWFSVLAEYQYRPQLARLHNAISCVVGDFSSVIHDPSLGRAWSTEGFTSFGMFFFQPSDPKEESLEGEMNQSLLSSLQMLSWVDRITFSELRGLDPRSQSQILVDHRKTWDYEDWLEISKKLGGSEWFVTARAQAMDANYSEETPAQKSFVQFEEVSKSPESETEIMHRPSRLRRWATAPLAAIPDGRTLEIATEKFLFRSPFRKEVNVGNARQSGSGRDGSSEPGRVEPEVTPSESLSGFVSAYEPSENFSMDLSMGPLAPKNESRVAFAESESEPESGPLLSLSPEGARRDSGNMNALSFHTTRNTRRSSDTNLVPLDLAVDLSARPPPALRTSRYEVGKPLREEERMDRMERLMEGLMMITSEQALQAARSGMILGNDDPSHLQSEMARLRYELDVQSKRGVQSQLELNKLRSEIATLQALLQSKPRSNVAGGGEECGSSSGELSLSLGDRHYASARTDPAKAIIERSLISRTETDETSRYYDFESARFDLSEQSSGEVAPPGPLKTSGASGEEGGSKTLEEKLRKFGERTRRFSKKRRTPSI